MRPIAVTASRNFHVAGRHPRVCDRRVGRCALHGCGTIEDKAKTASTTSVVNVVVTVLV